MDLLDGYKRKKKQEICARYEEAALISTYLAKLQDSKNEVQIPFMWDVYPELFANEKRQYEELQRVNAVKEAGVSRREYARYYNQRRKQGLSQ